ncbi:MAG: hypothetical protein ABIE68_02685 [bacterium]
MKKWKLIIVSTIIVFILAIALWLTWGWWELLIEDETNIISVEPALENNFGFLISYKEFSLEINEKLNPNKPLDAYNLIFSKYE